MAGADQPARLFRNTEVMTIANLMKEGESCALFAIGNSGKSRLLQSLAKQPVRERIFGAAWPQYMPIYVDGNGLLEDSAWGLYELMLDSALTMLNDCCDAETYPRLSEAIRDLHMEHTRVVEDDPKWAYRWLARAVGTLFRKLALRNVAFLLDDIDRLIVNLDPALFRQLKSLRDRHKDRLSYVVATRRPVPDLCPKDRLREIDGFYKLIKANTYPLGLYHPDDARDMVHTLMRRVDYALTTTVQHALIHESGSHPGLLRAAFFALRANRALVEAQVGGGYRLRVADPAQPPEEPDMYRVGEIIHDMLKEDAGIREECYDIWAGLDTYEQIVFENLVTGGASGDHESVIAGLAQKRLLKAGGDGKQQIFSPLFAEYVREIATRRS